MGRNRNQKSSGRYRLELDERERIVCYDDLGNKVPLGRCISIGYGIDPDKVRVGISKSCELGDDFGKELKERLKGGTTVWKLNDDELENFENNSYLPKKRRKKKATKSKAR